MKKLYKISASARLILTSLILTLAFSEAWAGDKMYYWYVNDVMTYPTGGGTVYIAETETEEADRKYDTEMELKSCIEGYGGENFYGYAKPNDGFIFLGWKALDASYYDDILDDPSIKVEDYLSKDFISYNQNESFYLKTTAASAKTTPEQYHLVPDTTLVALFGHVSLLYVSGQNDLGTMEIEDPTVGIGDFTYITATPNEKLNASFLYWLDSDGNVYSTDARCEINVTKNVTYTAVFAAPDYETLDFGEGGYKVVCSPDKDVEYDNSVVSHTYLTPQITSTLTYILRYDLVPGYKEVEKDTVINGEDAVVIVQVPDTQEVPVYATEEYVDYPNSFTGSEYVTDTCTYYYGFAAGDAVLLHGTGLTTIHYVDPSESSVHLTQNKLTAASADGTDIATLDQDTAKYYLFDEKTNTFNAATSGVVPAGSGYLVVTNDMPEYKYDKLYFVKAAKYESIRYDVNSDGSIDTGDVLTIYNAIQSGETDGMDVDGNGTVDTQDVLSVYEKIGNN